MRHRKHKSKLNRTSEHRKAMLRNMAISLITYERIHTTATKAKILRGVIEPLVTLARRGEAAADDPDKMTHIRRQAFSVLQNKEAIKKLFSELGPRFKDRPGGYTRVIKTDNRPGDGAPMAFIEFLDAETKEKKTKEPEGLKEKIDHAKGVR